LSWSLHITLVELHVIPHHRFAGEGLTPDCIEGKPNGRGGGLSVT
jgi:hypothetical protein